MGRWRNWHTCLPAGRRAWFRKMYFNYILKLSTDEFYKGLTSTIDKRLKEHLNGKVRSTRNKLPFKLIHVELCNTRIEARKIENFFKSGYGREVIREIEENLPRW